MTTIVAVQGDGWVVMGSDTQSTLNDYQVLRMGGHKIYSNNGVLIAGAGQGRGLDLLHKGWEAPCPPKKMTDPEKLDEWMVYNFASGVRELFVEHGYDMKDDGHFAQHSSAFLVAVNGVVYYLDDDYSVDRDARGIMFSGTGGDFASGALYAQGSKIFRSPEDAVKAVILAVNVAKDLDAYSGGETRTYVQVC